MNGLPLLAAIILAMPWVRIALFRPLRWQLRGALIALVLAVVAVGAAAYWPPQRWAVMGTSSVVLLMGFWANTWGFALIASPATHAEQLVHVDRISALEEALADSSEHVFALAADNQALRWELEAIRAFAKGMPLAGATFTRPADGMRFVWGTDHWFPFHDIPDLAVEEAVGTSHYELNPEVASNAAYKAVHQRISRGGPPEGDVGEQFLGKPLAWTAWGGPDGTVSLAAIRVPAQEMPAPRPPQEVRAQHNALMAVIGRLEGHYAAH